MGDILILVFNLLTAAKAVFLGAYLQHYHPLAVLCLTFIVVTLFAFLVARRARSAVTPRLWGALNVSSTVGWIAYYYALKSIEPSIVTAITSGCGPIITMVAVERKRPQARDWAHWAVAIGILTALFLLLVVSAMGDSALGQLDSTTVLLGGACAFICAGANVATTVVSKKISSGGLRPVDIMARRFLLLILASALMCPIEAWPAITPPVGLFTIVAVAIAGVALPVWCYQSGVALTSVHNVALIHATIPTMIILMQLFDKRLAVAPATIVGAVCVTVLSIIGIYVRKRGTQ